MLPNSLACNIYNVAHDTRRGHHRLVRAWLGDIEFSVAYPKDQQNWDGTPINSPFWDLKTLSIVASHTKRNAFESSSWQSKLQLAIQYAAEHKCIILFNRLSPYSDIIYRACLAYDLQCIGVSTKVPTPSLMSLASGTSEKNNCCGDIRISLEPSNGSPANENHAFLIDRFLVATSEQLFALEVRENGKIAHLLKERLADTDIDASTVKVLIDRSTNVTWLNSGAVGWTKPELLSKGVSNSDICRLRVSSEASCSNAHNFVYQPVIPLSLWTQNRSDRRTDDGYLTHCTRARRGPWPDQTWEGYLDEILESKGLSTNSAYATLVRILKSGRLIATSDRKPGNFASVSFSAVPLEGLLRKRRFASHLGRWDWEPYGFCIKRSVLVNWGIKSVTYRTKQEMTGLLLDELRTSQVYSSDGTGVDWRVESEWRYFGDIKLEQISPWNAVVFVRTEQEARSLQHLSRWPILYHTHE